MRPATQARPRTWALRTSASITALAIGAIGVVGFASAASADHGECTPSDAVTHEEHTYTRTLTQWASSSPGDGWEPTGEEEVLVPAVLEYQAKKWDWKPGTHGQLKTDQNVGNTLYGSWDYKWFSHEHDADGNGRDWTSTGVTQVKTPAVMEFAFTRTETTGWLTESPGNSWTISDTRTVTDAEAVVCDDADPSLTASGLRFRPGQTVDLLAEDFLPGEDVDFVMHSKPVHLASGNANQVGTAAVLRVVIPANAPAGWHTIVATGLTSGRTASTPVEVLPADGVPTTPADTATPASSTAPAAPEATGLAETGNESLALLGLAGSLALIGAGLVGMRRMPAQI